MGRKRSNGDQPIGVGLTAKQMRRKKPINSEYLVDIEPITENQKTLLTLIKRKRILLLMVLQVQVKLLLPYLML